MNFYTPYSMATCLDQWSIDLRCTMWYFANFPLHTIIFPFFQD